MKPSSGDALEPLLTLDEAAKRLGDKVKASSLRTEIRRGRLTHTVVAGKHYVTESDLRNMVTRCRVEPRGPASTCETLAGTMPPGLSSTEQSNVARDAALKTAQALKKRSQNTLPANTNRRAVEAR
jgi:hypothetical protein